MSAPGAAYPSEEGVVIRARLFIAAVLLLAALIVYPTSSSAALPSAAVHVRHVIAFFDHHRKLARTPAGERALWRAVHTLDATVRKLQAVKDAKAAAEASPAEVWARGSFATCVRFRESHDGQDPNAHGNLYGVQRQDLYGNPYYSWAANVSRSEQNRIAYELYLRYGDSPWAPYDGCHG